MSMVTICLQTRKYSLRGRSEKWIMCAPRVVFVQARRYGGEIDTAQIIQRARSTNQPDGADRNV